MISPASDDRHFGAACSLALVLLVTGCPVDDRAFVPEDEGYYTGGTSPTGGRTSGGRTSSGGSPAQSGAPSSSGGSSGESSAQRVCPDLDENGVEDCAETLVANADFSRGIELWKAEPNVVIKGDQQEASENSLPGSLSVSSVRALESDGLVTAGASQCVSVPGGGDYAFYAQVLIPDDQSPGSVGLLAMFFDSTDCSSAATGGFMSELVSQTEAWVRVGGTSLAPETAASVSLRLLTVKPFRQPRLEALFDDILVRAE
jgi:hypothetical protein